MGKISIEFDVLELQMVMEPIQDQALIASKNAAKFTPGSVEQEIVSIRSQIFQRVATRMADALYPDLCRWMDDEGCPRPIASDGLCTVHLDHKRKVAQILGAPA